MKFLSFLKKTSSKFLKLRVWTDEIWFLKVQTQDFSKYVTPKNLWWKENQRSVSIFQERKRISKWRKGTIYETNFIAAYIHD